jgi:hypothetical protein
MRQRYPDGQLQNSSEHPCDEQTERHEYCKYGNNYRSCARVRRDRVPQDRALDFVYPESLLYIASVQLRHLVSANSQNQLIRIGIGLLSYVKAVKGRSIKHHNISYKMDLALSALEQICH